MKKAVIVYESVFGNTERLAFVIAEGINESGTVECTVKKIGEIHPDELANFDVLIFGCPNHNQEPARNLLKFIDRVAIVNLAGKLAAAFETYTGGNKGVAVSKLERILEEKISGIRLVLDSFSAQVVERHGPIVEDEIDRARNFGKAIARVMSD